ncbi:unnamed protein product [Somion occarium]
MRELCVKDVLKMRCTCRHIAQLTKTKQLWCQLYRRVVAEQGIPVFPYMRPLDILSPSLVEALVVHMVRLDEKTMSQKGARLVPLHQPRSVTWIRLVRGQWLLVASSDLNTSVISLWSLSSLLSSPESSKPIVEAYLDAPVAYGMVQCYNDELFVALYLRGTNSFIDVLTIRHIDLRPFFCHSARFTGASHLRFFDGDWIGCAVYDGYSIPHILNWKTGDVERLCPLPDPRGGCLAMARWHNCIATITPKTLEIYLLNHDEQSHYAFWRAVDLPRGVGSVSFFSEDSNSPLRFCLSGYPGIFLYQVNCDPLDDQLSLMLLWSYCPEFASPRPLITFPSFGVTGQTLSWLSTPRHNRYQYCSFVAARLFHSDSEGLPPLFELDDPNLPAQYLFGVRDFDEARGVAVFGNGFGELVLYDFSHSDPYIIEKLSLPVALLPYVPEEQLPVLPMHAITSFASPPFPYCRFQDTDEAERMSLFEFWRSYTLPRIPIGWDTDWENSSVWHCFTGNPQSHRDHAWLHENVAFFLGQPILLIRRDTDWGDEVVFMAGGLLFMFLEETGCPCLLDPSVSLGDLLAAVDAGSDPWEFTVTKSSYDDFALQEYRLRTMYMYEWERVILKRNRWQELHDRGGNVHPALLEPFPEPSNPFRK